MNFMENTKISIARNSINYGIILGFTLIIISVISYLFGSMDTKTGQLISSFFQYAIIIIGIFWGTKSLRTSSGGFISYGRALGSGTLICLFASIVLAIYLFIFFKFIDKEVIKKMIEQSEQRFVESGLSDEQLELSMSIVKKTMTPVFLSLGTIWSLSFMGFLFSLITSIFLQKKGSSLPWANQTIKQDTENNNNPSGSDNQIPSDQHGIEDNKKDEIKS
jgi:hypothetical protein